MKRLSVLVPAAALTAGLLSGVPASARTTVTPKDFPSAAKVATAVPALAGATRSTKPLAGMPIVPSCTTTKVLKASSARVAIYTADSSTLIATGMVAEMKSVKAAKRVLASRRKELSCGTVSAEGLTATYAEGTAAQLGDDRVAQRITIEGVTGVTDLVTLRKGARVIAIGVVSSDGATSTDLTPLVRAAYRTGR